MFQQVVPYRIPEELWAQAVFNNGTGGTTYCTGQEINDPGQEVPGHRLPGQEVPGHRHPGQEVPGQEVPGHRHPGQEVPGHRPAQEAQRPPPAKRSPATTTSTTPYTKGRFSVSRIDTPPHEAEHIFINQENGNRASQTPKKSRKSFLVSTLKKTQLRRSRKLEALEVMRSRRRSGATEANLFVKKSWADVVKFGVTQPQKQSHNPGRKAKMTKRRTKIKVLQTPAQKMKAQIRTGHADSPATIVIGRAHSRTVHLTGHIPKVVKNYALKLNLDQDESFTGMSELFNSPLSDKQRSSCLEGNQNDMTQNKSSIDQTSVLQTPEESGDMVVSPLNITSVTTERPYNRDAVSRLLRSPISTELHKGNDQILETVMQMGGITRPTTECKVKKIKTPPKKRETIDLTGIKRITPKQKGKPVTDPVALKRLLRTPRQMESLPVMYTRRSPQQVEDLVGIKRIMKTPKQKGEPVEDLVGIKRIMRTPKQKGESVEDLVGIKRIMRTPKQKGESVEDLVGIKEIMRTPRQEEEPVEDMVGIKHIMKTPKLKGRPVEDLMGISHIMRTPPRENTHPIEEIIGIKQLKKTPQKKSAPVKELDVMPLSETRTSKTLSTKTTYSRSTTSLGQLGSNHSISNELSQDNWLKEMQHLDASENNAKSTPARRSSKSLTRLSNSSTQGLVRPEVFPQDKTYRDSSVESFFAVNKTIPSRISQRQPTSMGETNKAEVQRLPGVGLKDVKSPTGRGRSSKSWTHSAEDLEESEARISDDLPQSNKLEASTEAQVQESVPVSSSETPTQSRRRGRPSKSLTRLSSSSAGDLEASVARISDELPQNNRPEASTAKAQVQESVPVSSSETPTPSRRRGRPSKSLTRLSSSSEGDLKESDSRISDELPKNDGLEASTAKAAHVPESVPVSSSETPTPSRRRGRPSNSLTRLSSSSAGDLEASVARISDDLPQNNRLEASKAQVQESVPVSSSKTPTPSRRRGRLSKSLTRLSSSSAGGLERPNTFPQDETYRDSSVQHPFAVNKTQSKRSQRQLISMGDLNKAEVHTETKVQKFPAIALNEVNSTPIGRGRSSKSLTRSAKEDLEASVARISNELPQNNQLEASTAVAEAQESVLVSSNETPTPSRRRGRPSKSLTRLSSSSAGGSKQPDPFTQEETGGDSNVRHPLVNKTPSRSAQRQLISMGDSTKTDVHSETEVQKLPSVALKEVQSPTRSGRSSTSLTRSAEDLEASDLRISDELPQNNRLEASTAKAAQVQASTPVSSSETPTPSRRRGRPSKSLTRLSSPRQLIRMGDSNKAEVHTETEVQKLPGVALKEVKSTSTGRGRSSKSLTRSAKEDLEESEARISDDLPQSNKLEASTEAQVQETVPVSSSETPTPSRRRGRPPKSRTHLSSSSAGVLEEPKPNFADSKDESRDKSSHVGKRTINIRAGRSRKNVEVAKETTQKIKEQADIPNSLDIPVKITQAKRSQRKQINLQPVPKSTAAATTAGEIQNASSASSVGEQLSLKRSVTRNKVEDTVEQSREETILQRSPKKHAVEIRVETEILTSHTALVVKSVRTKNTAKKRPVRKPSQISPAETKEFNVITESEETLLEDLSQTSNNTMEAMWKNNENVLVEEQTVKSPKHKATRSTRQHQKAMLTELTAEAPTKQLRGRRNKTTAQDRLHLNITLDKGDLVLHEDTAASTIVTKSVRRGRHARGSNTNSVTELIKKESANENLSALSRQDVVVHEHKRSTDGGPVTKTRRVRKKQNLEGNTNVDSMDQHDSADVASVDIKEIFTRSTCGKKDPPQAEALHTETGTRLKGRKPANVKNKLKAMDDSVQISTRQNIEKENSSIPKSVHWHPLLTNMETSENNLSKETVPNNENKISNRSIRSRGKNKLDMPEATIPAKRSRRGKIEENTEEGSLNQSDTGKSAEMSETDSSHSLVSIKESIKVTKRGRNKMETNQNTPLEQIITVSKGSLEGHTEKSKEDPERIASTMDFKETVNDKTINKRNIGKRNITLANPLPSSGGQRDLGVDSNMTIDENLRNRKLGRRRAVAKNLDGEKKEQDKVTEIPISNQRRGRRASSQTKVHDGSKSSEPFSKNKVSSILETKGTEAISTKSRLGLKRKIANAEVVAEIPKACEPLSYTIAKSSSISKSKTQNATSARGRRNIRNISTQNEEAAISPKENGKASKQSPAKNNKTEAASITTQKKRGKSKVDAVKSGKATQVVKTRASARTRK
ncbi:hypothetical protein FKM82_014596 [Ascaphus truei]